MSKCVNYNVIEDPIPIGRPNKYQPSNITNHVNDNSNITGIIFFIVLIIPTFPSLLYLYIKPIVIIKYTYIGENNLPIESDT